MNTAILNKSLMMVFALLMLSATPLLAQVYKVVDKDGNVTYTDQAACGRFRPDRIETDQRGRGADLRNRTQDRR